MFGLRGVVQVPQHGSGAGRTCAWWRTRDSGYRTMGTRVIPVRASRRSSSRPWRPPELACSTASTTATRYAENGDVRLHYAVAGPEDASLAVFIDGFPDFWYSLREQMAALEDRFRVAALDMRGYNLSDKPVGRRTGTQSCYPEH